MSTTNTFPFSSPRYIVVYVDQAGVVQRDWDWNKPSRMFPPSLYADAVIAAAEINTLRWHLHNRMVARVLSYDIASDTVTGLSVINRPVIAPTA